MKRLFLLTAALVLLSGLDLAMWAAPKVSGAYEPAFDGMPRRRRHRRPPRREPHQHANANANQGPADQPPVTPPANDNGGTGTDGKLNEGPDAIHGTQEGPTGVQGQNFTGTAKPSSATGDANKNARRTTTTTTQPNKNAPQPSPNANSATPPQKQ